VTNVNLKEGLGIESMKDPKGNPTAYSSYSLHSHLLGLFNRTIQFLNHGIKPIWIFDGKPPEHKKEELKRRRELKAKAEEMKEKAEEEGKLAEAKMMAGRSVKITTEMTEDAKKLIRLLGLPMIEASSEAEAQCSVLVKAGKAYATATEDMDALTFGSSRLIRGFNTKKDPICEITLETVLKEFKMTMDEFIDLCILCGCDYTQHIDGIGPVKAFKFIQDYKTLEKVIENVCNESGKTKKHTLPASFDYVMARKLFKEPDVLDPNKIEVSVWCYGR
jgi:flap endonuclease-1